MVGIEHLQPAAGLEGSEVWNRTVQTPEHRELKKEFASIRVGGVIGTNKTYYQM